MNIIANRKGISFLWASLLAAVVFLAVGYFIYNQNNTDGLLNGNRMDNIGGIEDESQDVAPNGEQMARENGADGMEVQEYNIKADDFGFYINGNKINDLNLNKGAIRIVFMIDNVRVYYGGLDFRGCRVDSVMGNPGDSVIFDFEASENCIISSYWPESNVLKDRLNVIVH